MLIMAMRKYDKLNQLDRELPEGLLVDAAWLSTKGYSAALRSQYVSAGRLQQPAGRVYRRPRGALSWQQAVLSLQLLLQHRLVVGGRTALELHGYTHYLSSGPSEVHLYGPSPPPTWLSTLPLKERFVYHNSNPLFGEGSPALSYPTLAGGEVVNADAGATLESAGLRLLPWGQWDWPMVVSTPERAILEELNELPDRESFHQVDMLMEGLGDLSARRLEALLVRCRSVKVKRLFFFFADRHGHAWLKRLDRAAVDLGKGKRMLVKGGRLDAIYAITVPRELDEAR